MDNITSSDDRIVAYIDLISNYIGYYGISTVSLIGILINIFIKNLLRNKSLNNTFYKHISIKIMIDLMICIVGIGYLNTVCLICSQYLSYEIMLYYWVVIISTRYIFFMSTIHEIYLITNRFLILKNRNNWIVKIMLKYYVSFLILVPLCFYLPTFFVITIKRSKENSDYFNRDLKESSNNIFFRVYFLLLIFFETILPLISLLTMTVLCHNEYKKRIQIKSRIIVQAKIIAKLKKLENSYTRITIILTCLFMATRCSDCIVSLLIRAIQVLNLKLEKNTFSFLNFLRQFTYLLYFGLHALSGLMYIQIDSNLRILVKRKFSKIKVMLMIILKFLILTEFIILFRIALVGIDLIESFHS